jgi:hypothetical protein
MSSQVFGQSLECQLLRDEIVGEARQRQAQNSEQIAYINGYAAGQNLTGAILGQSAAFAQRGASGLSQALGQTMNLEQKIQVYQQTCEK